MNQAYLILGSNISPEKNIPRALKYLAASSGVSVLEHSSSWITRPVGSKDANFVNMAVHISTSNDPHYLKEEILCRIESNMGRVRTEDKNAPRTIDIDIVIFNEVVLDLNLFKFDYLVLPFSELLPDFYSESQDISLEKLAATIRPFSTATKITLNIFD